MEVCSSCWFCFYCLENSNKKWSFLPCEILTYCSTLNIFTIYTHILATSVSSFPCPAHFIYVSNVARKHTNAFKLSGFSCNMQQEIGMLVLETNNVSNQTCNTSFTWSKNVPIAVLMFWLHVNRPCKQIRQTKEILSGNLSTIFVPKLITS